MGAKPNRKSRHGLGKAKAGYFPAGTVTGRLSFPLLKPHKFPRKLTDAQEDIYSALKSRLFGDVSEPRNVGMRAELGMGYGAEIFSAPYTVPALTDYSKIEERILASITSKGSVLIGFDPGAPGGDKTAFATLDADGNWTDIGTAAHRFMAGLPEPDEPEAPPPFASGHYRKD